MEYRNDPQSREEVVRQLVAEQVAQEVAAHLIDDGGIGTATIRELGAGLIARLLRHTDAGHLIAIVLALDAAKIRTLDQLQNDCEEEAFAAFIALDAARLDNLLGQRPDGRPLLDIVLLLGRFPPADALELSGVHAGIDTEGLIHIGNEAAQGERALAEYVRLANGAPELNADQVAVLGRFVHTGIDVDGLIQLVTAADGPAAGNRRMPELIQLANDVQDFTAAQVLTLACMHAGIGVDDLVDIGNASVAARAAARPLADLVHLANAVRRLNAGELRGLARRNVWGRLGEVFLENAITGAATVSQLAAAAHAASLDERQTIISSATLRSVISASLRADATVVMSSLLEGSHRWKNPKNNDFYQYFFYDRGKGRLPSVATMNCWESILYAAYLAKLIDADWIYNFYLDSRNAPNATQRNWEGLGFDPALPEYPDQQPAAGQLLFYVPEGMPYPGHVSLALGGDLSMSLWNQPNNVHVVQRIKINALRTQNDQVLFANPPW